MSEGRKSRSRPSLLTSELCEALEQAGYRYAVAPISLAGLLWEEVARSCEEGLLSEEIFAAYQESWRFVAPEGIGEPRTLIAIAWSSMPLKLRFQTEDGSLDATVPPTYVYSEGRSRCLQITRTVLESHGHHVEWARVPVKLLAVCTGLAEYGRNNLTYVPGLGSHVRLGALCTDAVLEPIGPTGGSTADAVNLVRGHRFMDVCLECHACSRACPTGCIPEDGTVIDATRCLTYANENEGDWPGWVPAWAHNSLVGCMRCQEVCPANRAYVGQEPETLAEFDFADTQTLLRSLQAEQLSQRLRDKLVALDLDEYSPVLGRNLLALQRAPELRIGADT